jgi:hypothetical protein
MGLLAENIEKCLGFGIGSGLRTRIWTQRAHAARGSKYTAVLVFIVSSRIGWMRGKAFAWRYPYPMERLPSKTFLLNRRKVIRARIASGKVSWDEKFWLRSELQMLRNALRLISSPEYRKAMRKEWLKGISPQPKPRPARSTGRRKRTPHKSH